MEIDATAPLKARKETVIRAAPEKVWAVHTDIDNWPKWQPDVSSARLEGSLMAGSIFRWKALGLNITSRIQELVPQQRIGWTGDSLGMKAVHIWTFEAVPEGTRVITEESLSGWFPLILKLFSPRFLEKSLEGSLKTLKTHVEQL